MATSNKIKEITPEQKARFPEWSQKWIKIGLSTEPADFNAAIDAAMKIYDHCAIPRPKVIIRASSPYEATVLGALSWSTLKNVKTPENIHKDFKENINNAFSNYGSSSLWASRASYISFLRDVMGWENEVLEKFALEETIIKSCGWTWWHEDVFVVSDRPLQINRDDAGRLHCENKPSIEYRDGWKMFHWHGISMPEECIMKPENITVAKIDAENNQEIRRAMIEIYGYGRYVESSPVVSEDATGKLRRRRNKKGDEITVVEVLNGSKEPDGSTKTYFLSVPPEMKTAMQAVAWTYGLSESEYKNIKVRT